MARDNLPIALSPHFGSLAQLWVVPLMVPRLTPGHRTPHVHSVRTFGVRQEGLLLSKEALPIGSSTARTTSVEVMLRHVLVGTSCFQVRWAFHPYTQITGGYCRTPTLTGLHAPFGALHPVRA